MVQFINMMLSLIYLVLGWQNVRSLIKQKDLVKQLIHNNDNLVPAAFQTSIRLKLNMLNQLHIVVVLFFLPKFFFYGYEGLNSENQFSTQRLLTAIGALDTVNFIYLLVIFFPKK